jgi:hypothetical protein
VPAPRAIAIDSLGYAWNTVGHPDTQEKLALVEESSNRRLMTLISRRDGGK